MAVQRCWNRFASFCQSTESFWNLFGSHLFRSEFCNWVGMSGRFFPLALMQAREFRALRGFYSLIDTKCILRVALSSIVSSSLRRLLCINKIADGNITTGAFLLQLLTSLSQIFTVHCCNVLPLASGSWGNRQHPLL